MPGAGVLITGADGYLGRLLVRRYLEATSLPVLLWIRAQDEAELRAKGEALAGLLEGFGDRAACFWGDLRGDDPFAQVDPAAVGTILHAAAITRFGVDRETADQVNVRGTEKLLEFAERCPRLERLGLISTIYSSGLTAGAVEEAPLEERPRFANHYERSKWEAEALVLRRFSRLPWRIFRLATVVTDDESGLVIQQNAVHNTLKLLYYGLLSLIPGNRETPVYLVTGQFIVDSIFALMCGGEDRAVYHVAHGREDSLTLGGLIDVVYDSFRRDESFRRRRILRPMYTDEHAFMLLAEAARAFAGGVVNQAVSSVAPFAKQLFVEKDVRNERLVAAVGGYRAPDAAELVARTCNHLVQTRWGLRN